MNVFFSIYLFMVYIPEWPRYNWNIVERDVKRNKPTYTRMWQTAKKYEIIHANTG
jgi:hypothetical protein